jgi:Trypsin
LAPFFGNFQMKSMVVAFFWLALLTGALQAVELTEVPSQAAGNSAFQLQVLANTDPKALETTFPLIANGLYTSDYPSVGALLSKVRTYWDARCAATLVGCHTLVTAAHCVEEDTKYAVFFPHAGFYESSARPVPNPDFVWPNADIAIVRLTGDVSHIAPSPLSQRQVEVGSEGIIVGYGRATANAWEFGLKRQGTIKVASCVPPAQKANSICWDFKAPLGNPGSNSSICYGDSGGALFIPVESHLELAGVTSGEPTLSCSPGAKPIDTRVTKYRDWVASIAQGDLNPSQCLTQGSTIGSAGATYYGYNGALPSARRDDSSGICADTMEDCHTIIIDPGTKELRLGLSGFGPNVSFFSLSAGSPNGDATCPVSQRAEFSFCSVVSPPSGKWNIIIKIGKKNDMKQSASGVYQIVATVLK